MLASLFSSLDRTLNRLTGLERHQDATAGRFRARQIMAISQLTPAMMLASQAIAAVVAFGLSDTTGAGMMVAWAASVWLLCFLALQNWWVRRKKEAKPHASKRSTVRATINAAVLGSAWALLPLMLIGEADPFVRVMVNTVVIGMICGGAFALAPLPQAVLAFVTPLIVSSSLFMLYDTTDANAVLALMFVVCVGIIVVGSTTHAKMLVQRVAAEIEAREKTSVIEMLLKSFVDNSSDWLWRVDTDRCFRDVSLRFTEAAGIPPEELEGRSIESLWRYLEKLQESDPKKLLANIRAREAFKDIIIPIIRRGERRWWRVTGEPTYDDSGVYAGYRGVGSDVTEAKLAEERVIYLAHHDVLTGLANRVRFNELLSAWAEDESPACRSYAVHFIDLDRFKMVNDTKGHAVGDSLLIEVARRFEGCIGPRDALARLGGDEFAVLQVDVDQDAARELAVRLIKSLEDRINVSGDLYMVGVSVGIAMAPADGQKGEQLLRSADLALYRAKDEGRGGFRFFQKDMDRIAQERQAIEADLAMAEVRQELYLHFQPLVDAKTSRTTGFEALIRWDHSERGTVSPAVFIPIAESTGQIRTIGRWVVEEACRAAASWPDHLKVAVNLSPSQFVGSGIVEIVRDALAASALEAGRLELEITESLFVEQPEEVLEKLQQLKALGVSIAMDDFGTGYSSLSYLWQFPFDKIKIDRSFVSAIERDQVARDILQAITTLGSSLKMRVTAEGVETEEQAAFLRTLTCDQFQGFLFAKPLAPTEMAAFLMKGWPFQAKLPPNALEVAGAESHRTDCASAHS
ncbi:MAG TPA: EAL domain-containing protein [Aurantimonas sp.]|jgi:diguanylate cyclase (GGDEF)-like protein/PAS domain S-box-containing protein|nr:EAL domain-containing protein [Aurantimonas sp.]